MSAPTTPRTGAHRRTNQQLTFGKITGWFGERTLDLLALGGIICIIAVIAAFFFNISLILFKTGSMSPTIPAGSVAIVREIPASEMRIGDVITIDRQGQLPVTHRVISTKPINGDMYSIEMKGDANDGPDPTPYEVTQGRQVLWSIPGAGKIIAEASTPMIMGGITLAMTLLVTWAFWPRKTEGKADGSDAQS